MLAFGLIAAVLVGFSLLLVLPNASDKARLAKELADTVPVHVMTLDVRLTRNINGSGRSAGVIGTEVYDPHLDDTVTVDARLSQTAYAFLIAFLPDGKAEVCFPENDDELPALTDNPRYPSTAVSAGKEYGLSDGTGLEAFALVVSSQSLPSFKEWWPREGCPWKKENAPPGVVYRANGEDTVEVWGREGPRGKGVEIPGKTPVVRLASWLRTMPGIATVQVLGFTVGQKEKR